MNHLTYDRAIEIANEYGITQVVSERLIKSICDEKNKMMQSHQLESAEWQFRHSCASFAYVVKIEPSKLTSDIKAPWEDSKNFSKT